MSRLALAALLLAGCAKHTAGMPDAGAFPPNDPYHHDTQLTTGRMEGFRHLYVDPATWPDAITPTSPASGKATLVIDNPTSAWALLTVGGTQIGQVRPFDAVTIHDVAAGSYDVRFELPNRYAWTESVSTR